MKSFRFGVAGPGQIASKFVQDLEETEDIVFAGAASNTPENAQNFVNKYKDAFSQAVAFKSYEEMARDPNIDAVYISNLNTQHARTAKLFLQHNKPVLCEKPFAINAIEAEEIVEMARRNNTFVMEAMWTRFLPAVVKVRKWIDDGMIGMPIRAMTDFGMDLMRDRSHRTVDIEKGGGALLDLGIYPISFFSMLFGPNPKAHFSVVSKAISGVDASFDVVFRYDKMNRPLAEDYPTAYASVSIDRKMSLQMKIIGTSGYIEIEDFFAAKKARLYKSDNGNYFLKEPSDIFETTDTALGYKYEAIEVMKCVRAGKKESTIMPTDESVAIMKVVDMLRKDWDIKYPREIKK